MHLASTQPQTGTARRAGWIRLALAALPVLVASVAPVLAQQPGNIFDASDQTLGNGLKAFIRYMRNFFFLLGFIFLALMGWNIANNKPWGNKLAGVLGSGYSAHDPAGLATFFLQQAAMVGAATLALVILIPWLKQLMRGVR